MNISPEFIATVTALVTAFAAPFITYFKAKQNIEKVQQDRKETAHDRDMKQRDTAIEILKVNHRADLLEKENARLKEDLSELWVVKSTMQKLETHVEKIMTTLEEWRLHKQ